MAVKWPEELNDLDGLIIPGGESTTIGKLMVKYGFVSAIREAYEAGLAIYGTCAGLIMLAKRVSEGDQPLLALMDVEVKRNAFGRQVDSFEEDLRVRELGDEPFRAVFIRAPWIEKALASNVEVLAECRGRIVGARQGRLLATAFHPELTDDTRVHDYFLSMIGNERSVPTGAFAG